MQMMAPPGPPLPRKRTNKTPIVIVPPSGGMTGTLINKYNVKDILQVWHLLRPIIFVGYDVLLS